MTKDGPYQVDGGVPLSRQFIEPNAEGESWDWRDGEPFEVKQRYLLCRCGGSSRKPFCDSTHETNGFDGTETASRASYLDQAEVQEGPDRVLTDAQPLCASARFCDARGDIWHNVEAGGEEPTALADRASGHCPSGRLLTWIRESLEQVRPAGEPEFEPAIGVVEDPAAGCSAGLWVRGGIEIVSEDGTPYEVRNRVALCRCGASSNKPFCDGTHRAIRFDDGAIQAERQLQAPADA